jgi:segregation and condensation protein A
MPEDLKISLPLFEGPLDLLLDMIRRQKLDIYDIPIAKVTEQYLSYIRLMQELNIDVASEFLVIAAQLIYIKSRMLLPPDPDAVGEESEDPRAELVRRLLEYEQFKNAAEMLHQRELIENAAWSNPGSVDIDESELEPELAVTLYDLLLAFRDVVKRAEERPTIQLDREEFSIEQMMGFLLEKVNSAHDAMTLTDVLPHITSRRGLITAFLALLELTRLKAIYLRQEMPFGEISVWSNPNYELSKSYSPAWYGPIRIMSYPNLTALLEAIIYVAKEPVSLDAIYKALPGIERAEVQRVLDELVDRYRNSEHGIEIREVADGFRFSTKPEHHEVLKQFIKAQIPHTRLSLAALETLAVIAYKQPVTVPEIQEIRGVHAAGVIKTLLDKKFVNTAGRKEVLGRPILYKTTREFLIHFGLKDIGELPSMEEFDELIKNQSAAEEEIPEEV